MLVLYHPSFQGLEGLLCLLLAKALLCSKTLSCHCHNSNGPKSSKIGNKKIKSFSCDTSCPLGSKVECLRASTQFHLNPCSQYISIPSLLSWISTIYRLIPAWVWVIYSMSLILHCLTSIVLHPLIYNAAEDSISFCLNSGPVSPFGPPRGPPYRIESSHGHGTKLGKLDIPHREQIWTNERRGWSLHIRQTPFKEKHWVPQILRNSFISMLFHAFRCVAMLFDSMLCSSPRLSMAYQGQGKTLKDTGHLRKGRVITGSPMAWPLVPIS